MFTPTDDFLDKKVDPQPTELDSLSVLTDFPVVETEISTR